MPSILPHISGYNLQNTSYENIPEWAKVGEWSREHENNIKVDGYILMRTDKPSSEMFYANLQQWCYLKEIAGYLSLSSILYWNQMRIDNPDLLIILCGVDLSGKNLSSIDLQNAHMMFANLSGADLSSANFKLANMYNVNMDHAILVNTHFEQARLLDATFNNSELWVTCMEEADMSGADVSGTSFVGTSLLKTKMFKIDFDSATDFTGSNISEAFMLPEDQGGIQYVIRRKSWQRWRDKKILVDSFWKTLISLHALLAYLFWWISDFGISTKRIMITFAISAIGFGFLYWCLPELVINAKSEFVHQSTFSSLKYYIYSSIMIMSTGGTGEMSANSSIELSQIVFGVQVLLGFILLGAFITRMGIVFTGKGPARKPKPSKEDREMAILSRPAKWIACYWLILIVACMFVKRMDLPLCFGVDDLKDMLVRFFEL